MFDRGDGDGTCRADTEVESASAASSRRWKRGWLPRWHARGLRANWRTELLCLVEGLRVVGKTGIDRTVWQTTVDALFDRFTK